MLSKTNIMWTHTLQSTEVGMTRIRADGVSHWLVTAGVTSLKSKHENVAWGEGMSIEVQLFTVLHDKDNLSVSYWQYWSQPQPPYRLYVA